MWDEKIFLCNVFGAGCIYQIEKDTYETLDIFLLLGNLDRRCAVGLFSRDALG